MVRKSIAALALASACCAFLVAPSVAQRRSGTVSMHVAGSPPGTFIGGVRSSTANCARGRRVNLYRASKAESTGGPYDGRLLPGSINRKVAYAISEPTPTVRTAGKWTITVRTAGWYFVKVQATGRCREITMGDKVIRYRR